MARKFELPTFRFHMYKLSPVSRSIQLVLYTLSLHRIVRCMGLKVHSDNIEAKIFESAIDQCPSLNFPCQRCFPPPRTRFPKLSDALFPARATREFVPRIMIAPAEFELLPHDVARMKRCWDDVSTVISVERFAAMRERNSRSFVASSVRTSNPRRIVSTLWDSLHIFSDIVLAISSLKPFSRARPSLAESDNAANLDATSPFEQANSVAQSLTIPCSEPSIDRTRGPTTKCRRVLVAPARVMEVVFGRRKMAWR